jgi:serine/threonine protein kinase
MRKELIRNRYLLLKQIGSGGFATVFQAWDYNLEKFVAVKRILQHLTSTAIVVDTFRQEALRSAKLQHENIVQVYDFFRSVGNICYIIMEYVRGKDLLLVMKRCKEKKVALPPDVALKMLLSVAKALGYAHEKRDEIKGEFLGILHLDVSPANIMIYSDGRIKLTDFGIAKAVQAGAKSETDARNVFKGKYNYMSPEQIRGTNIDHRSDLFSLGIVLYELLTGLKPFDASSDNEIMDKILKSNPDFSKVPAELSEILKKLLEKNPIKRYKSSKELIAALEQLYSKTYGDVSQESIAEFLNGLFPELQTAEESEKELMQEVISKVNISEEIELEKTPTPITIFADSAEKTVLAQPYFQKKKNRRIILAAAFVFVAGVLPFEYFFDIPNALTPAGTFIKKRFIPISLAITSSPDGAEVKLFDDLGEDVIKQNGYKNVTPVRLRSIKVGDYTLKLNKPGFRGVTRKVVIDAEMAASMKYNRIELNVPFEIDIEINSVPDGAEAYIDGRKTGVRTPFQISLEANSHTVGLVKDNFLPTGTISADKNPDEGFCSLNFSNDRHGIDKELWELTPSADKSKKAYVLTGYLRREVEIDSSPQGAKVFAGDRKYPSGKTPSRIGLKPGKTNIRIEKDNYITINAVVTPDKEKYSYTLAPSPAAKIKPEPVAPPPPPEPEIKEVAKAAPAPVPEPAPKPKPVEPPKKKKVEPPPKHKPAPPVKKAAEEPEAEPAEEKQAPPPVKQSSDPGVNYLSAANSITDWFIYNNPGAIGSLNSTVTEDGTPVIEISFDLSGGKWIGAVKNKFYNFSGYQGVKFDYRGEGSSNTIEFKLEDSDGSNFGLVLASKTTADSWTTVKIPFSDMTYWWGGDQNLTWTAVKMHYAISQKDGDQGGAGKVLLRNIGVY